MGTYKNKNQILKEAYKRKIKMLTFTDCHKHTRPNNFQQDRSNFIIG